METAAEERYQLLLTELEVRRRWYETSTDLFFAAVVGAVDDIAGEAILAGIEELAGELPPSHELHLISPTVAAVTIARRLDAAEFVAGTDGIAEQLRDATRSKRFRLISAAVLTAAQAHSASLLAEGTITLFTDWKERHFTNASDLVLAAITVAARVDPRMAVDSAELAAAQLADAGYRKEWGLARTLAIHQPAESAERFVQLADRLRGWRRKPLTDRRHMIAIAALSRGVGVGLPDLVARRAKAVRTGRWRPDDSTTHALAALLTFGESVGSDDRLRAAFHGFVIREHYRTSYAEATSD